MNGISFCIPTNGAKPEKTLAMLRSIDRQIEKSLPMEIILCGDIKNFSHIALDNVKLIFRDESIEAHNGMLARLRNLAAEFSNYDILVFVDDDFIFPEVWFSKFVSYNETNDWQVLTNKILLPSGGRFWDRATFKPHRLVSYDHDPYDPNLYITGGFWIIKKSFFKENLWNGNLEINASKNGEAYNEDIELSIRIHKKGIPLLIDEDNLVWHWDNKYTQTNNVISLKYSESCEEFKEIIKGLRFE